MKTQKFKPILFSTEMVQAILESRKTQTRRVCKYQFWYYHEIVNVNENECYIDSDTRPRYQKGDILWVRETFGIQVTGNTGKLIYTTDVCSPDVDKPNTGWKPSIHMPKEAARIFLEVTDVRVERLQDISEEDAMAEGVNFIWYDEERNIKIENAYSLFKKLWQKIYSRKHPWESNPWVWVYTFNRIEKPENF